MKATLKSAKAGIRKLIEAAQQNKLGAYNSNSLSCAYSTGKRRCAIGFFFTDEQIKYIKDKDLNSETSIRGLVDYIGEENLIAMTGFNIALSEQIQSIHDFNYVDDTALRIKYDPKSFIREMEKLLNDDPRLKELLNRA